MLAVVGEGPAILVKRRRWGDAEVQRLSVELRPLLPVTDGELEKAGVASSGARRRVLAAIGKWKAAVREPPGGINLARGTHSFVAVSDSLVTRE